MLAKWRQVQVGSALAAWVMACAGTAGAATYYVAKGGTNAFPYSDWGSAASNIHDVVALATNYDTILISNGVFSVTNTLRLTNSVTVHGVMPRDQVILAPPGTPTYGVFVVSNALAQLDSLTISNGIGQPDAGGVRLYNGTVSNCVVRNCRVSGINSGSGGGIYMTGGLVAQCTIQYGCCAYSGLGSGVHVAGGELRDSTLQYNGPWDWSGANLGRFGGNTLYVSGGVARRCVISCNTNNDSIGYVVYVDTGGRIENSLVVSNSATAYGVYLNAGAAVNCTVVSNRCIAGGTVGGVYLSSGGMTNCIVAGNAVVSTVRNVAGALSLARYSCAPELTTGVNGNISDDPQFVNGAAGNYHLTTLSPCIDRGTNAPGTDLDGTLRPLDGDGDGTAVNDMGAYEAATWPGGTFGVSFSPLAGQFGVAPFTNTLAATVLGDATETNLSWYGWDTNSDGVWDSNLASPTFVFDPGRYTVTLLVSNSLSHSAQAVRTNVISVVGTNIYVATTGTPAYPYATPATAATNVHDGIGAALGGCTVNIGAGTFPMVHSEEVFTNVQIYGAGTNATVLYRSGSDNYRLFFLRQANSLLTGVVVSNGYMAGGAGIQISAGTVSNCVIKNCGVTSINGGAGGGIYMTNGLVAQCTIQNCLADKNMTAGGSGVYMTGGELRDSTLRYNGHWASQSRWAGNTLYVGGGVARRCVISCNTNKDAAPCAVVYVNGGGLESSLVVSNVATTHGVYVNAGRAVNCTMVGNNAIAGGTEGGAYLNGGGMTNCIVAGNTLVAAPQNLAGTLSLARYSCAPELTTGVNGNISDDPQFVNGAAGDYHLTTLSPCIDKGTNVTGMVIDLGGTNCPLDGDGDSVATMDMGAYEAPTSAGTLGVTFSPLAGQFGIAPFTNTLAATLFGGATNISWYGWDTNSDGVWDSNLASPTFVFGPGRYTVTLRVTNTLSQSAQAVRTNVVSVVGTTIYVATTGTPVYPYLTPATAATNVHDGIGVALGGCTVNIGTGAFPMVHSEDISTNVQICGAGTNATLLYRSDSGSSYHLFFLNQANALVAGVVVSNGSMSGGGGVQISAGTLSNCVVRNCGVSSINGGAGGGIYMTNGLVTRCIVQNCFAERNQTGSGSGVYMTGGELRDSTLQHNGIWPGTGYVAGGTLYVGGGVARRCVFSGNTNGGYGGSFDGSTVYVDNSGRLENSLVVNNAGSSTNIYSGVYLNAGALLNCTIVTNKCVSGTLRGVYLNGGGMTNCIVSSNLQGAAPSDVAGNLSLARYSCAPELTAGTGNISNAPLFEAVGVGNYRLSDGSPCINTGTNYPGATSDFDLDQQRRVRQIYVDMGAYEWTGGAGTLFMVH